MSLGGVAAALAAMDGSMTLRLALVVLGDEADNEGRCAPGAARLAARMGCSEVTALKALADLEGAGAIRRERQTMDSGTQGPQQIFLTIGHFLTKAALVCPPQGALVSGGQDKAALVSPNQSSLGLVEGDQGRAHTHEHDARAPAGVPQGDSNSIQEQGKKESTGATRGAVTREIEEAATDVWEAVGPFARRHSTCQRVAFALRDLVGRGGSLAEAVEGARTVYLSKDGQRDGGRWVGAPHKVIEGERWREVLAAPNVTRELAAAPAIIGGSLEWAGRVYQAPPDTPASMVGTDERPGLRRQLSWMEDWISRPPALRAAAWLSHRQGPPPGAPGCRVWPSVMARFEEGATHAA